MKSDSADLAVVGAAKDEKPEETEEAPEATEETRNEATEATEATETEEVEATEETTEETVDPEPSETESRAGVADEVEEAPSRLPNKLLKAAAKDDVLAAKIARAMLGLEESEAPAEEEKVDEEEVRKQFKALIAEGKDYEALKLVTESTKAEIRREVSKKEAEAKREQAKQRDRTLRFIEFTQKYPDWRTYEKDMVAEYKRLANDGLGKAAYEGVAPETAYFLAKARRQGGPVERKAAAAKAVEQTKREGAAATGAPAGAKPATAPTKQKADAEQALIARQIAHMRKQSAGLDFLR